MLEMRWSPSAKTASPTLERSTDSSPGFHLLRLVRVHQLGYNRGADPGALLSGPAHNWSIHRVFRLRRSRPPQRSALADFSSTSILHR